jgi:hypothetical protein
VTRSFLAGLGVLVLAQAAAARPIVSTGCFNDTDCGGPQCGGDVCNWSIPLPNPGDPDKPYTCNPAGTSPKGIDGWCTSDENCKCRELGAKCVGVYCSFTKPSDTPQGVGGATSMGMPIAGGPAQAGTSTRPPEPEPMPDPIEPTPSPAQPVGRDDTTSRTSRACALAAVGHERNWASLALILAGGAAFVGRRSRPRFIPQ